MSQKMVFFDIDGTLIDFTLGQTDMLDSTKKAIKKLQNKGHLALVATGRCPCFIPKVITDFGFSGWVTCNGAYVELNGNVIYKEVVDTKILKQLKAFYEERQIDYFFESRDFIYVRDKSSITLKEFAKRYEMKEETLIEDFNVEDIEVYVTMAIFEKDQDWQDVQKEFGHYFSFGRHPGEPSADLSMKDCSKAKGIQELVKRIGLDMKDTYAFGDGHNDIEMIQTVEYGIAMGNGVDLLKEIAKYHTDHTEDDGIEKGLKQFKLI